MRQGRAMLQAALGVLPPEEAYLVKRSFDVIGDIAVIKLPDSLLHKRFQIAESLMEKLPSIKVVLRQLSPVEGEYRVRSLEWIAGEKRMHTLHKESGCLFKVNLSQVYFSPRLAYERMRIAKLVKWSGGREVIVNMFSGVGCFSIIIAKKADPAKIYSIDINSAAIKCLEENVKLNKVEKIIIPILGDAKQATAPLHGIADRVLMPLPEKALEYLPYAVQSLKDSGWIHYYDFHHYTAKEESYREVASKISEKLRELNLNFHIDNIRTVRPVGPNWYQIAVDIKVI